MKLTTLAISALIALSAPGNPWQASSGFPQPSPVPRTIHLPDCSGSNSECFGTPILNSRFATVLKRFT